MIASFILHLHENRVFFHVQNQKALYFFLRHKILSYVSNGINNTY